MTTLTRDPVRAAPVAPPTPAPQTRRARAQARRRRNIAIDALGTTVLTATALSALVGTYDGPWWVVTSAVALVAGMVLALALDRFRMPWWAAAPALLVLVALLAPPLTMRSTSAGPWPTPTSWAALADTATDGWRRLLTTLPPVDGAGPLSLLPFLLALVGGCATLLVARRVWSPYLPVLVPALVGAASVAFGVVEPGGVVARGAVLLVAALVWGTTRSRRRVVVHTARNLERLGTAALLLVVVGVIVIGAVPWTGTTQRQVLREHVEPPYAATDRPSPLAAFRSFRPVAEDLADKELVRVGGLPQGTLLRLATVDTYSGTVWAAGNATPTSAAGSGTFLRVGARIPRPDGGREARATVTVGKDWADRRDLGIWVPTVGSETRIRFEGPRAQDRADELRYNLDTGAAVLPQRLSAGETYVLDERIGAPQTSVPTAPPVDPTLAQPMARLVAASATAGGDPMTQLRAVATRLRTTGAYSDGGTGEETILPGHSSGRLTSFVAESEPAGNDEQFAATLALSAAYLGMPARVVLGALPEADGLVRGRDVRAWVEVHDGTRWQLIAPDEFVPARDKKPKPRAVVEQDTSRAATVPPPTAQRPPSSEDGFSLDESASGRSRTTAPEVTFPLPLWARVTIAAAAVPVLGIPLWTGLLVLVKTLRRVLRTRRGSAAARSAAAWDDVLDSLRDAGYAVSRRDTRREVAASVGGAALLDTARAVDGATFGPAGADDATAERAWALAGRARHELAEGRTRRERWRRAVALTSLLPSRRAAARRTPSGIHAGRITAPVSASAG
ncbi:transglutaminase-like domain-containing protein [Phycicoccus sonneratiae]|uniref:Transglutaminase domain-containing protein n=1 Tax=Phycicoccus sonneratiae TaxID=2807628 RepID=A0ABS2CJA9_9MICO|nr:transglutaminase-like domain-containing protein [Phycicoccus sonneraticus]MBM6399865.1 transglutaminase domain-containing protein [Phycicoccus sonneraticus]